MNRIRFLAVLAAAALPMVASLPAHRADRQPTSAAPKVIGQPQQPQSRAVDDRAQRQGRQARRPAS